MKKLLFLGILALSVVLCSCTTIYKTPEETLQEKGSAILVNVTDKNYSFKLDSDRISTTGTVGTHSAMTVEKVANGAKLKIYDTESGSWIESEIPKLQIVDSEEDSVTVTMPVLTLENGSIRLEDTWTRKIPRDSEDSEEVLSSPEINAGSDWQTSNYPWNNPYGNEANQGGKGLLYILLGLGGAALVALLISAI